MCAVSSLKNDLAPSMPLRSPPHGMRAGSELETHSIFGSHAAKNRLEIAPCEGRIKRFHEFNIVHHDRLLRRLAYQRTRVMRYAKTAVAFTNKRTGHIRQSSSRGGNAIPIFAFGKRGLGAPRTSRSRRGQHQRVGLWPEQGNRPGCADGRFTLACVIQIESEIVTRPLTTYVTL